MRFLRQSNSTTAVNAYTAVSKKYGTSLQEALMPIWMLVRRAWGSASVFGKWKDQPYQCALSSVISIAVNIRRKNLRQ